MELVMIGYGAAELAAAFRTVRKNTMQIADEIPEDKYEFVPAGGARSVAALLRHIVYAPTVQEDMHRDKRITTLKGYDFAGINGRAASQEMKLRSKADIVSALKAEGERVAGWLESLNDEFLAESFTNATGETKSTRFEALLGIKEHEMHHRGQLMLIQRMLGIVPHLTRIREERIRQRQAPAAPQRG